MNINEYNKRLRHDHDIFGRVTQPFYENPYYYQPNKRRRIGNVIPVKPVEPPGPAPPPPNPNPGPRPSPSPNPQRPGNPPSRKQPNQNYMEQARRNFYKLYYAHKFQSFIRNPDQLYQEAKFYYTHGGGLFWEQKFKYLGDKVDPQVLDPLFNGISNKGKKIIDIAKKYVRRQTWKPETRKKLNYMMKEARANLEEQDKLRMATKYTEDLSKEKRQWLQETSQARDAEISRIDAFYNRKMDESVRTQRENIFLRQSELDEPELSFFGNFGRTREDDLFPYKRYTIGEKGTQLDEAAIRNAGYTGNKASLIRKQTMRHIERRSELERQLNATNMREQEIKSYVDKKYKSLNDKWEQGWTEREHEFRKDWLATNKGHRYSQKGGIEYRNELKQDYEYLEKMQQDLNEASNSGISTENYLKYETERLDQIAQQQDELMYVTLKEEQLIQGRKLGRLQMKRGVPADDLDELIQTWEQQNMNYDSLQTKFRNQKTYNIRQNRMTAKQLVQINEKNKEAIRKSTIPKGKQDAKPPPPKEKPTRPPPAEEPKGPDTGAGVGNKNSIADQAARDKQAAADTRKAAQEAEAAKAAQEAEAAKAAEAARGAEEGAITKAGIGVEKKAGAKGGLIGLAVGVAVLVGLEAANGHESRKLRREVFPEIATNTKRLFNGEITAEEWKQRTFQSPDFKQWWEERSQDEEDPLNQMASYIKSIYDDLSVGKPSKALSLVTGISFKDSDEWDETDQKIIGRKNENDDTIMDPNKRENTAKGKLRQAADASDRIGLGYSGRYLAIGIKHTGQDIQELGQQYYKWKEQPKGGPMQQTLGYIPEDDRKAWGIPDPKKLDDKLSRDIKQVIDPENKINPNTTQKDTASVGTNIIRDTIKTGNPIQAFTNNIKGVIQIGKDIFG